MAIKKEVLDELLAEAGGKDVFGKDGLFNDLKKALAERILNAEMDHHLAGEQEDEEPKGRNHRNGYSKKRVLTDTAKLDIEIPRDREGSFEPALIAKYQRRFPGFDEKVVSMYARGLTVREIQGHLQELYGIEVSPDLISTVIAPLGLFIFLLTCQMVVHLGIQYPLGQRLLQIIEQAVLAKNILAPSFRQKLIQYFLLNCHNRLLSPSTLWHYTQDS